MSGGADQCRMDVQGQDKRCRLELPAGIASRRVLPSSSPCSSGSESEESPAATKRRGAQPLDATPSTMCSEASPKRMLDFGLCTPSSAGGGSPCRHLRSCRFCLECEEVPFDTDDAATAGTCTDLFVSPCPCRGSNKYVHLDCLLQHFQAQKAWHNFKCPTCKQTYEGRALRELAEFSRHRMVQDHGPQSPQVAHSLCYLAQAHAQLGCVQEAKEVLEAGLEMTEAHYGRGHVATAAILAELATTHGKLGDVQMQRELLERSLGIKESHFGQDHINTAVTLNNLAAAYSELGDIPREKELLERSLHIKEQHYGKGSVQTTAALVNLAGVYSELGDVEGSRRLLESALVVEERHFGPGHVETAVTLNNLALACGESGDVEKMRALLLQCLSIKERHFGTDHQELCLTLANLGLAHGALGYTREAQSACERAATTISKQRSSRRYGVVLLRSASVQCAAGQDAVAQGLFNQAVEVLRDALGPQASERILAQEVVRMERVWSQGDCAEVPKRLQAMLNTCCTL